MTHAFTYEPHPEGFRLLIDGEPCGGRLVKQEPFPFRQERWWIQPTEAEAKVALEKLSRYLERCDIEQLKGKK